MKHHFHNASSSRIGGQHTGLGRHKTRRTVSMSAETYVRFRNLSVKLDVAMATMIDQLVNETCDRYHVREVTREEALDVLGLRGDGDR